jgi:hypothetical protein
MSRDIRHIVHHPSKIGGLSGKPLRCHRRLA